MSDDTNLVVGAGFSGAVIAERIATELNEKVTVIDKKDHIGGNSYDYVDENGIVIHKYGSHIFHTNNNDVWNYVNCFSSFNTYMHRVYAVIDGIETTIPFNFNTLYDVFPENLAQRLEKKLIDNFDYNSRVPILDFKKTDDADLLFLSDFIYEKIFLNYTSKQWGKTPDEIDCSVTARVPVLISKDSRYFQDKFQGIPCKGYTKLIENILNNKNIEVVLNTDYNNLRSECFKRIFFTGSIDEYFSYRFGTLPYRSVKFKLEEHDCEFYQKNSVVNYPNNYNFTRIHEYKHYLNNKSAKTVIAKEYSEEFSRLKNEPCYPIENDESKALYSKYKQLSGEQKNVYFLGRLGDYKYYNMDQAIERSLQCFESLFTTTEASACKKN